MRVNIVIPARLESKRFREKPLKKILGIPMVIRVANICKKVLKKKNILLLQILRKFHP